MDYIIACKGQPNIKKYFVHLHFIPEAGHFTFKVLLTANLHGFLPYIQTLDLRQIK